MEALRGKKYFILAEACVEGVRAERVTLGLPFLLGQQRGRSVRAPDSTPLFKDESPAPGESSPRSESTSALALGSPAPSLWLFHKQNPEPEDR